MKTESTKIIIQLLKAFLLIKIFKEIIIRKLYKKYYFLIINIKIIVFIIKNNMLSHNEEPSYFFNHLQNKKKSHMKGTVK